MRCTVTGTQEFYTVNTRMFVGVYPTGIIYADRKRERGGDYARLGFLCFRTLELDIEHDCPPELRPEIVEAAAGIQARKGEEFPISACGQTVLLGPCAK